MFWIHSIQRRNLILFTEILLTFCKIDRNSKALFCSNEKQLINHFLIRIEVSGLTLKWLPKSLKAGTQY